MERLNTSVIERLEATLNEIELLEEYYDMANDDTNRDDSDDESIISTSSGGETELFAMMDSLVAQLQAEIQEQIVDEYRQEKQEGTTQINMESTVVASESSVFETRVPMVGDADYACVSDYTHMDSPKKELLQRLKLYLSDSSSSSMTRKIDKKISRIPQEDRVYQSVPEDTKASTRTNERFERFSMVSIYDTDYVPVKDFSSPNKYCYQEETFVNQQKQNTTTTPFARITVVTSKDDDYAPVSDYTQTATATQTRQDEMNIDKMTEITHEVDAVESCEKSWNRSSPVVKTRRGKRDKQSFVVDAGATVVQGGTQNKQASTNLKKKKKRERLLLDTAMREKHEKDKENNVDNDTPPSRYTSIQTLANSKIWKAICALLVDQDEESCKHE